MFKLSFDPELYRREWVTKEGWRYESRKKLLPTPIYVKIVTSYCDAMTRFSENTLPLIEVVKIRVSSSPGHDEDDFAITISVVASHHHLKEEKSEEEDVIEVKPSGKDWTIEMATSISRKIFLLGKTAIFNLRNQVHSRCGDLDMAIDSLNNLP